MKIFIGKLPATISEQDLRNIFKKYGHITSIYIRKEVQKGNSFLYGLIEMPVKKQALAAIRGVKGKKIDTWRLSVHQARVGEKNRRHSGRLGGRREDDPAGEDLEK